MVDWLVVVHFLLYILLSSLSSFSSQPSHCAPSTPTFHLATLLGVRSNSEFGIFPSNYVSVVDVRHFFIRLYFWISAFLRRIVHSALSCSSLSEFTSYECSSIFPFRNHPSKFFASLEWRLAESFQLQDLRAHSPRQLHLVNQRHH